MFEKEGIMSRMAGARGLLAASVAVWVLSPGASPTSAVLADGDDHNVSIRDDCDPADPAWNPTGGCTLRGGDVTFDEFFAESGPESGPLALSVIGHQGWWNDPPYLKIEEGETVKVRNRGGRIHTFTEVAEFGGGRIPVLNKGLEPAPECNPPTATSVDLRPGAKATVQGLSEGNHRFQCCIHPWMRALIKVKAEEEEDKDDK
jgi:plastocyanin